MRDDGLTVEELVLPGVMLITPTRHDDARGYFVEGYNTSRLKQAGIETEFVQDAVSRSHRGVLRGLHYQKPPHAQAKLVRCTHGEIFDVAADIDPASPTYGKHISVRLSGENQSMLYIPRGYAHGFCVLSDVAVVEYKLEAVMFESGWGVRYDDPVLSIPWPITAPILSEKDASWPPLTV